MNRKKKKRAEIPGIYGIFALYMVLALAGLTGCGRQELEFYTEEELAEASGTQDASGEEDLGEDAEGADPQEEASAAAQSGEDAVQASAAEEITAVPEPVKIFVDVCGAVANPGVYELEADSRVFQAIELAGGYLPEAAQSYLNRASLLADGQQIYVPTQSEVDENPEKFGGGAASLASGEISGAASGGAAESANGSGKVNLNTADISELTTLTGIGETRAQAIIAYREASGGFQSIEELMKVDGIKEGTFAKIKDQITVG